MDFSRKEETRNEGTREAAGLAIPRKFTVNEKGNKIDPYESLRWEKRSSSIRGSDGSVVFEMEDLEIPADWSTVSGDMSVGGTEAEEVRAWDSRGRCIITLAYAHG